MNIADEMPAPSFLPSEPFTDSRCYHLLFHPLRCIYRQAAFADVHLVLPILLLKASPPNVNAGGFSHQSAANSRCTEIPFAPFGVTSSVTMLPSAMVPGFL